MKIFHEERVDLVIVDITMPEQEGIEDIMRLRNESPELLMNSMSGDGCSSRQADCSGAAEKPAVNFTSAGLFPVPQLIELGR